MPATSRWALRYPAAADNAAPHTDLQNLATDCDNFGQDSQGVFASRPISTPGSPGKSGRYYYATDRKILMRDFGTGWSVVQRFKLWNPGFVVTNSALATIATLTIPANTLINADQIAIKARGEWSGINGNKQMQLQIAGTNVINYTAAGANTNGWYINSDCMIDTASLRVVTRGDVFTDAAGSSGATITPLTDVRGGAFPGDAIGITLSSNIDILFRAGTTSGLDNITLDMFELEVIPAGI